MKVKARLTVNMANSTTTVTYANAITSQHQMINTGHFKLFRKHHSMPVMVLRHFF